MTSSPVLRRPRKLIDTGALLSNCLFLKKTCGGSRLMAVVKADAYGHGLQTVVSTLRDVAHGFAVATVQEGLLLRRLGIEQTILIMQGFIDGEELTQAVTHKLSLLVHNDQQIEHLRASRSDTPPVFMD